MNRTARTTRSTTRTSRGRIAIGTAAGVAVASLGLFVAPAVAGNGPGTPDGTCDGTTVADRSGDGQGARTGNGMGYRSSDGQGYRSGAMSGQRGAGPSGATRLEGTEQGELTSEQEAELTYWVEEEKVAQDLYAAFAARYDAGPFERIATSETRHLEAVRTLLVRYGLDDPTDGAAAGSFEDDGLQAMYDDLLAQGAESYDEALAVGRAVETTDLKDLAELLDGLEAPDVQLVAERQVTASERHLAAFGG